jgi:hypothetical protein
MTETQEEREKYLLNNKYVAKKIRTFYHLSFPLAVCPDVLLLKIYKREARGGNAESPT